MDAKKEFKSEGFFDFKQDLDFEYLDNNDWDFEANWNFDEIDWKWDTLEDWDFEVNWGFDEIDWNWEIMQD